MIANSKFKLYLPGLKKRQDNDSTILVADLGEETSILGLFMVKDGCVYLQKEEIVDTHNFSDFEDMIGYFIRNHQLENITRIVASLPGFVLHGKSNPKRLHWELDAYDLKEKLGVERVCLINDLEAAAYGLAGVSDPQLVTVFQPENTIPKGNMAVIAPGNGLGEAGLFYDGKYLRPFATEGGHCEFSPRTNVEVEFYQFLNHIYGIVTWEHVLSKHGLYNIYRFLRDVKRHPEPEWLNDYLCQGDFSQQLYSAAVEEKVSICQVTIETYLEFLAREANSLALKLKATGGLVLAGELPILLKKHISWQSFYDKFKISDKMENLLKEIPIHIVTNHKISLYGAAYFAAFSED
ncbi:MULTISPECIES: glucokinase [Amniculibacterium]|uniref:glucokinase n=1 Tax=Amniculibacterium TaxID=2715289 RepID=UPI000F5B593E|nr:MULTISPECIES: glucokinase [Amniculibacterium]